jgi:putative polyhydroxyalkanoate system protein
MPTIEIRRSHTLPKDEARKRAEDLANSLQEKLSLQWRWEGDRLTFDAPRGPAKGTTGSVEVTGEAVTVQIDLPFLLRMVKGKVESRVEEKLRQVLA